MEHQYCSGGRGKSSVVSSAVQKKYDMKEDKQKIQIIHIIVTENEIVTEFLVIEKKKKVGKHCHKQNKKNAFLSGTQLLQSVL
jgi:hypothetical protein